MFPLSPLPLSLSPCPILWLRSVQVPHAPFSMPNQINCNTDANNAKDR
ncbi:hypothetical protein [Nostoc linckia]|nr:hypothetical protein [Nostoc linckia]